VSSPPLSGEEKRMVDLIIRRETMANGAKDGNEHKSSTPVDILLVEDSPEDVELTKEALKEGKFANVLNVVKDGVEAIDYLKKKGKYTSAKRPDLILLDLNLPKKNGHEVLAEIKQDEDLKVIPVAILTTSESEQDVIKTYKMHANCYITKPVDLNQFIKVVKAVEDFWFSIVKLPRK
jgi:two-component system, chemotaxis family, response regulator Rcp1